MNFFRIVIIALAAIVFAVPSANATTVISPIVEVTVDPGTSQQGVVKVYNETDHDLNLVASIDAVRGSDERGEMMFGDERPSFLSWISLERISLILKPRQAAVVPLTVKVQLPVALRVRRSPSSPFKLKFPPTVSTAPGNPAGFTCPAVPIVKSPTVVMAFPLKFTVPLLTRSESTVPVPVKVTPLWVLLITMSSTLCPRKFTFCVVEPESVIVPVPLVQANVPPPVLESATSFWNVMLELFVERLMLKEEALVLLKMTLPWNRTFPVPKSFMLTDCSALSAALQSALDTSSTFVTVNHHLTGAIELEQFRPREAKPVIDNVDRLLAEHYGLNDEELDFIINYDIKYRMGLDDGNGEAQE